MISEYKSETGVDKWIRENVFTDSDYKGLFIEIGAATPEFISNSYHYRINGWRTICIEPNPYFVELHKNQNSEVYQYACSDVDNDNSIFKMIGNIDEEKELNYHSFSHLEIGDNLLDTNIPEDWKGVYESSDKKDVIVKVRKLNTILEELTIEKIDVITIDVEGNEMNVLKGFDIEKYKPNVIVIENLSRSSVFNEFLSPYGYSCKTILGNYDEIYTIDKK